MAALDSERHADAEALRVQIVAVFTKRLRLSASGVEIKHDGHQRIIELTLSWLLDKKATARPRYLAAVDSWLEYAVTASRAAPWEADRFVVRGWPRRMEVRDPHGWLRRPAHRTVIDRFRVLSSWFTFLSANGVRDDNPAAAIIKDQPRTPPPARRRPARLSIAASAVLVERAIEIAEERGSELAWRDAALATTLYYTGIPVRALISIDLDSIVGRADDTPLTMWLGDDSLGGPLLPLPTVADRCVRAYLQQRAARHHIPPTGLRGPLLVSTPRPNQDLAGDNPLSATAVRTTLTKLAEHAGVPRIPRITPCTDDRGPPSTPTLPPIMRFAQS